MKILFILIFVLVKIVSVDDHLLNERINILKKRKLNNCYLATEILNFHKEASVINNENAGKHFIFMSNFLFKKGKQLQITREREMLKLLLNKIFHPDKDNVYDGAFQGILSKTRKNAVEEIEKPHDEKKFESSKLISLVKYLNFSFIASLVLYSFYILPKIEKKLIEKFTKKKIYTFTVKLIFLYLRTIIFNIVFQIKRYDLRTLESPIICLFSQCYTKLATLSLNKLGINQTGKILVLQCYLEEFLSSLFLAFIGHQFYKYQHDKDLKKKKKLEELNEEGKLQKGFYYEKLYKSYYSKLQNDFPPFQLHIEFGRFTEEIIALILEKFFTKWKEQDDNKEQQKENKEKLPVETLPMLEEV